MNIAQNYLSTKLAVPSGGGPTLFDPLRTLLDDATEAAAGPGKYQDRMAFVIDHLMTSGWTADEEASLPGWGEFCARFGRRLLRIDSQGFVSSQRFRREYEAARAFRVVTKDWQYDESEDWQ